MDEQQCPGCGSARLVPLGGYPAVGGHPSVTFQYGCQRCRSVLFIRGWDQRGRVTGYAIYPPGEDWRQLDYTCTEHGLEKVERGIVWGRLSYG